MAAFLMFAVWTHIKCVFIFWKLQ